MEITVDDLTSPLVAQLLSDHLQDMARHSPAESVHALDVAGLCHPDITFWTVWDQGALLGCGALRQLDPDQAEIKSMRTAAGHLRKGVARSLLTHMIDESGRRGYQRLLLETGSMRAFEPARQLYRRFGFVECEPFAEYVPDPHSVFMVKVLSLVPEQDSARGC